MADHREHGIVFTAHEVQAFLSGSKTAHSVPLGHQNSLIDGFHGAKFFGELDFAQAMVDPGPSPAGNAGPYLNWVARRERDTHHRVYSRVQVGDLIWCREDHAAFQVPGDCAACAYRATCQDDRFDYVHGDGTIMQLRVTKWTLAIRMAKWAARIWLEVTSVTPARIVETSEQDALAEGVDPYECPSGPTTPCASSALAEVWQRKHGKGSWHRDAWAWRYGLRRVERKEHAA